MIKETVTTVVFCSGCHPKGEDDGHRLYQFSFWRWVRNQSRLVIPKHLPVGSNGIWGWHIGTKYHLCPDCRERTNTKPKVKQEGCSA